MTKYPDSLTSRFGATLQAMQRRITKLETRTGSIDSGFPLAVLPAVIDPAYSGTGNPNAYINGSATLTGPYGYLAAYTPVASDAVFVLPVGVLQTYVIAGKLG